MPDFIAALLGGLGILFIGVRMLSANLVPLFGPAARRSFAAALRGPFSSAAGGVAAGLLTQSSTAVSGIVLGLIRTGLPATRAALCAPAWSNAGTALLPLLVALDLSRAASYVIGVVGFAIYFGLDTSDRRRHALNACLGAAFLLSGLHLVSQSLDPLRAALFAPGGGLLAASENPWALAAAGAAISLLTQSSSVAAALVVAALANGLLAGPAALPMVVGANAAAIVNNLLKSLPEGLAGRQVYGLQAVQKAAGTVLLAAWLAAPWLLGLRNPGGTLALEFTVAQFAGGLAAAAFAGPVTRLAARLTPPKLQDTLAQPEFLMRDALSDPPTALNLALRELARLTIRLPLLLNAALEDPQPGTPSAATLRTAGLTLAQAIKSYLLALLEKQPGRTQVAAIALLQHVAGDAAALHEALAEFCETMPRASTLPQAHRLTEALHMLSGFVADHAEALGAEEPDIVLKLLGDRNNMMAELRQRLQAADAAPDALDALFRMTILFERSVWLARRLVTDVSLAHRTLGA